jgi:hypothetical protein
MSTSNFTEDAMSNRSEGKLSDDETVVPPSEVALPTDKDEKERVQSETTRDPNVVGWDGDHDTFYPMNWTKGKKWKHVALIALINFVTPLASSMFTPGVTQVQKEFDNYNKQLSSFVVSVYVLGCEYSWTSSLIWRS